MKNHNMSGGSYVRFVLGILLSLSVLFSFFADGQTSPLSVGLAVIFLILAVVWALVRF